MQKVIKLAIVGGSSTGKTTLFENLQKQHSQDSRLAFVHESARQFFNENTVEIPFDFINQEKILELALLNEKLALQTNPKIIITDTSALEVMFYTQVLGNEQGAHNLLLRLEDYIPTYTKFLVMNTNDVTFKNDDIRRESEATRDTIHSMLINFYQTRNLPFVIISGTVPQRQKKVTEIINNYLKSYGR